MGRPRGSRNVQPKYDAYVPAVSLFQADLDRYKAAALRQGRSFAEFLRVALDEATKSTEQFFYVRLPNGDTHPPRSEPGYEFFDNARRYAARVNGSVITDTHDPSADSGRNLPPAD